MYIAKNGLEILVSQFYTICDKNQLLNTNIDKVTAILAPRSWDTVPPGQVVPPGSSTSCLLALYLGRRRHPHPPSPLFSDVESLIESRGRVGMTKTSVAKADGRATS
jgi:hypothetical protein